MNLERGRGFSLLPQNQVSGKSSSSVVFHRGHGSLQKATETTPRHTRGGGGGAADVPLSGGSDESAQTTTDETTEG